MSWVIGTETIVSVQQTMYDMGKIDRYQDRTEQNANRVV